MTVAVLTNLQTYTFGVFADTCAALEGARAAAAIVQILVQCGHLPTVSLCFPPSELRILLCCLC